MDASADLRTSAQNRQALYAVAGVLLIWLSACTVFFTGFRGSDDFHYARFALFWDRFPVDHWEARLPYNALLRASFVLFGFGQVSAALPGMICSLLVLSCSLWLSWRYHRSVRMLWLVGILVATLPAQVYCTNPSARVLAEAGFCMGTVFLLGGANRLSALVAGLFLGLGVAGHTIALFPAVFLLGSAAILRFCPVSRIGLTTLAGVVAFGLANFGVYALWTGDPLYEFHTASRVALASLATDPHYTCLFGENGSLSAFFYWRGVRDLLVSQAFGLVPAAAILGGVITWRRRGALPRVLILALILTWSWICYGSMTPTRYTPFSLTTGYMGSLGFLFAWAAADLLLLLRHRALQAALAGLLVAANLGILSLAGPWGQSVKISDDLLSYSKQHLERRFVTDNRTLTEMCVLNGFRAPANVFPAPGATNPKFVQTPPLTPAELEQAEVLMLLNPLNRREGSGEDIGGSWQWVSSHCGAPLLVGESRYRLLTYLLPLSYRESHGWTLRRPPAKVCRYKGDGEG
jgi:hypothetical protein